MNLELTAKLLTLMPVQTGTGKNGEWTKQDFIVETDEQYPKKICIVAWNDTAKTIQNIKPFSTLKMAISIESREYNSRWYTDVRTFRIDVINSPSSATSTKDTKEFEPATADPMQNEPEAGDDLPF